MEIKYTNFDADPKIFSKNETYGIIDINSSYINESVYGISEPDFRRILTARFFLKRGSKDHKMLKEMISELELEETTLKKKMSVLSSSELVKVLFIKLLQADAKMIILDHADSVLNNKDFLTVLKMAQKYAKICTKKIVVITNKPDNILKYVDRYIAVEDGKVVYNGVDALKLPVDTELTKFIAEANEKGAKLSKYKDTSDLLKAIYRSVK